MQNTYSAQDTNIQTSQKILHKTHRGSKCNILEKFQIYKHHETVNNEILNDHITTTIYYISLGYQTSGESHPAKLQTKVEKCN